MTATAAAEDPQFERALERLLALSDRESDAMQIEICERLVLMGHMPSRANMLRVAGMVTDDEWTAAVGRMRALLTPGSVS